MIAVTNTRGLKRNLRLALMALCFLAGLVRAAQDGVPGAWAHASSPGRRIDRLEREHELCDKLKLTPHFTKNKKSETIKTFVEGLNDEQLCTINSIQEAYCKPVWWPVTCQKSYRGQRCDCIESLDNLLGFAKVMDSGRTQFRPIPSCHDCLGTGWDKKDDEKCALCDGTGKVQGEENRISCKVQGWDCDTHPRTTLLFKANNGKVLCTATKNEVSGKHEQTTEVTKMENIPVLEVRYVKDLVCPSCNGKGHTMKEMERHNCKGVTVSHKCWRCGETGAVGGLYRITLDKTMSWWNTLDVEINPHAVAWEDNAIHWEKILNFIRNVDTTVVKCRPQTSPGHQILSLGKSRYTYDSV